MKKKVIVLFCALLLSVSLSLPAMASGKMPYLVDNANLLTDSEARKLSSKLEQVSEQYQMDIVVVTTNSLYGKTPKTYAENFYDRNGYAEDGILLLISMEDSDWYICTTGYGITAITDAGLEYMSDQFIDYLSDDDYYDAFVIYADLCDELIDRARGGDPFDEDDLPKEAFNYGMNLLVCFGVGLVVALIITGYMRSKLKSVRSCPDARDYVKTDSMVITQSRDLFLYRQLHRQAKPNESGSRTHSSFSGGRHGGGGGKF